jgi:hypothetical protein
VNEFGEKNDLEDPRADGRIILKLDLKERSEGH